MMHVDDNAAQLFFDAHLIIHVAPGTDSFDAIRNVTAGNKCAY